MVAKVRFVRVCCRVCDHLVDRIRLCREIAVREIGVVIFACGRAVREDAHVPVDGMVMRERERKRKRTVSEEDYVRLAEVFMVCTKLEHSLQGERARTSA